MPEDVPLFEDVAPPVPVPEVAPLPFALTREVATRRSAQPGLFDAPEDDAA